MSQGEVQGNCRTVDSTGAQWCYVDTSYSSCADLVPSLRFPNNPWSYEACATPAPGSPLCPVASAYPGHPQPPPPVVTITGPELTGQPRETQPMETNFVSQKVNFDADTE